MLGISLSLILSVFISSFANTEAFDFPPPPLKKCHINDENCLIEGAQKYFETYGKTGIPELNIKPLEALKIEDFTVSSGGQNEPTSFKLEIKDMKMFNLTSTQVKSVKGFTRDVSKPMKLIVKLLVPHITYTAKYSINGKILILPIKGEGDAILRVKDVDVQLNILLRIEERDDGKHYLQKVETTMSSDPKNVNIYLSNLFNGEKELADNVLQVMNDNWRLLSGDFDPQIHKSLAKNINSAIRKIFKNVPLEEAFLED